MRNVDVAVVGGGPAGTSAGYAAASEGASTLVVEKGVPRADRADLGPDSTDAAGILDYWVDIMNLDEPIPEWVKHRELTGTDFISPNSEVNLNATGIDSKYPTFGFTMHRARFDDWLRERAEQAGAEYRVGTGIRSVDSDLVGDPTHTLTLKDGTEVQANYLILADGPQRPITGAVLEPYLPDELFSKLATNKANHIAYQEYRKIPEELFEPDRLKFWWGYMPGHTSYPWVFPNDGRVARVGLTMPIGLDIDSLSERDSYRLLQPDDERTPAGKVYIERLLKEVYPDYGLDAFPLQKDRGKRDGTETYPISSTRPIESPSVANIAVVGGAMGATSAFHEGGDHTAVRSGQIAGRLAALGALRSYNQEWQRGMGQDVRRSVALAEMVEGYHPMDWDRTLGLVDSIMPDEAFYDVKDALFAGLHGAKLFAGYQFTKLRYRNGRYCQIREADYTV
jgi:electron-transferring-flavoprotein dehydrogenase